MEVICSSETLVRKRTTGCYIPLDGNIHECLCGNLKSQIRKIICCSNYNHRPPLWSSSQSSWLHNGDVLCFLWVTNWIYICYIEESRPLLWSSGQSSWLQNGDVLCFMWCTNWIYICYVEENRPPLWSSGQSCWLHIQRSGFDYRLYQIFWEVVGLERGRLSLVSTTEELLGRKNSGSGLEIREYGHRRCVALTRQPSIRNSWH
jgi:hypothetical protein